MESKQKYHEAYKLIQSTHLKCLKDSICQTLRNAGISFLQPSIKVQIAVIMTFIPLLHSNPVQANLLHAIPLHAHLPT